MVNENDERPRCWGIRLTSRSFGGGAGGANFMLKWSKLFSLYKSCASDDSVEDIEDTRSSSPISMAFADESENLADWVKSNLCALCMTE
mmetsp:Transcript_760/g.1043  ORF Transcript_760/g.1043 Transcript_760/m.1043 type:complete len:89 (+) Transcript_760:480-746(+)